MTELARRSGEVANYSTSQPEHDEHQEDEIVYGELVDADSYSAIAPAGIPALEAGTNQTQLEAGRTPIAIEAGTASGVPAVSENHPGTMAVREDGPVLHFPDGTLVPESYYSTNKDKDELYTELLPAPRSSVEMGPFVPQSHEADDYQKRVQGSMGRVAVDPSRDLDVIDGKSKDIDVSSDKPKDVMPFEQSGDSEEDEIVDAEIVDEPDKKEKKPESEIIDSYEVEDEPEFVPDRPLVDEPAAIEAGKAPKELMPAPEKPIDEDEGDDKEPVRLTFGSVDQSHDARRAASNRANRVLAEELNEGPTKDSRLAKLGNFIKNKVWKGNLVKDVYKQVRKKQALDTIVEEGDIYAHESGDQASRDAARLATVERLISDLDEARTHENTGEQRAELAADSLLSVKTKELLRERVSGRLSSDDLREGLKILWNEEAKRGNEDTYGEGLVRVDNADVIEAALSRMDHDEAMEAIENMRIISAESRAGARTERDNLIEKTIEKLGGHPLIGAVGLTPELIQVGAAVATSLLKWGGKTAVHTASVAAMGTGLGFVASGAVSGLREVMRTRDDIAQYDIDVEEGRVIDLSDKRTRKIAERSYGVEQATDMLATLEGIKEEDLTDNDAVRAAIEALGKIEARIEYSEANGDALIAYKGGPMSKPAVRWDTAVARANAKVAINNKLTPELRTELGMHPGEDFAEYLDNGADIINDAYDVLDEDVRAKDRKRALLALKRGGVATGVGTAVAGAVGIVVQEGIAAGTGSREGLVALVTHHNVPTIGGEKHKTLLASIFDRGHGGGVDTNHFGPDTTYANEQLSGSNSSQFSFSKDVTFEKTGDTFSLTDHNGHVIADHLTVNHDGSLTRESIAHLNSVGHVEDNSALVPPEGTPQPISASYEQFMQAHQGDTIHVNRDFWYAQNVENPLDSKLNALGLDDSVGSNGHVQLSISGMTDSGSYEGSAVAHAHNLMEKGELKFVVYGKGSSVGIPIDIPPNGSVDVMNTPAAPLFSVENGRMVFHGSYVEAVEVGKVENGITHIRPLATITGNNTAGSGTYQVTPSTPQPKWSYDYQFTSKGYDVTTTEAPSTTDITAGVGVVGRTSLKPTEAAPQQRTPDSPAPIEPEPVPGSGLETTQILPIAEGEQPSESAAAIESNKTKELEANKTSRRELKSAPVPRLELPGPDGTPAEYQAYIAQMRSDFDKQIADFKDQMEAQTRRLIEQYGNVTGSVRTETRVPASRRAEIGNVSGQFNLDDVKQRIDARRRGNVIGQHDLGAVKAEVAAGRQRRLAQAPQGSPKTAEQRAITPDQQRRTAQQAAATMVSDINRSGITWNQNQVETRAAQLFGKGGARVFQRPGGRWVMTVNDAGVSHFAANAPANGRSVSDTLVSA